MKAYKNLKLFAVLVVVIAISTIFGAVLVNGAGRATTDGIDEIVVVGTDGYIYAYSYQGELVFQSPENGWKYVTTGDMNNDGDKEIIAANNNSVKVYDPQVVGNSAFTFQATYGQSACSDGAFTKIGVGDFWKDGQLDIALVRSRGIVNTTGHSCIVIYDLPTTTPRLTYEYTLTDWDTMAIGDYDNDGDDDFAFTYWNSDYPTGSRGWLELYQGNDPKTKLHSNDADASVLVDYQYYNFAVGEFSADSGDEWALSQNDTRSIVVQRWDASRTRIRTLWYLETAKFPLITVADFRNDASDTSITGQQVAMLRNTSSGVGLQLAAKNAAGGAVWATVSGLGEGWLNIGAGNLDTETKYKELVIVKSNLIRVYLQAQAPSPYFDCVTHDGANPDECFEDFQLAGNLTGEMSIADLGVEFEAKDAFGLSTYALTQVVFNGQTTVPPGRFTIRGEKTITLPITWNAAILPYNTGSALLRAAKEDPGLSLSIQGDSLSYEGSVGGGSASLVPWMALDAYHGQTPYTATVTFSDTTAINPNSGSGSLMLHDGANRAMILVWQNDVSSEDRFKSLDVTVLVNGTQLYMPLILR